MLLPMLASPPGTPLTERVARLIDRRGPDECWPWIGGRTRGDYGHMKVEGRYRRAPRLILHLTLGLDLDGDWVARHSCDNPPCCNPRHLLAGTWQQNVDDMWDRGRAAVGERMTTSKLTAEQVREIRRRVDAGESSRELAREFAISYEQVRRIARRTTWAWLE